MLAMKYDLRTKLSGVLGCDILITVKLRILFSGQDQTRANEPFVQRWTKNTIRLESRKCVFDIQVLPFQARVKEMETCLKCKIGYDGNNENTW